MEQQTLTGGARTIAPNGKPLTDQQQLVYDWILEVPGGVTADEVGALLHSRKGKHGPDQRCEWCAAAGLSILRSKAVGPLLIRRRNSGRYEPRDKTTGRSLGNPAGTPKELPGTEWEHIFGLGDAA